MPFSDPIQRHRVVFISRHNALRSVLAEQCLLHLGQGRFQVRSCGMPGRIAGAVHPAALGALTSAGMPLPTAPPRSWAELQLSRVQADFVIILADDVEPHVPAWPGQPHRALWSFPEVGAFAHAEEEAIAAIRTLHSLRRRLELLVSLTRRRAAREALASDVRDLSYLR